MNKYFKILGIVIVVLAVALIAYRFFKSDRLQNGVGDEQTQSGMIQRITADEYNVTIPDGFSAKLDPKSKTTEYVNASITKGKKSAFVTFEVKANPDNLPLQEWYDARLAAGDIPSPGNKVTVNRDGTVGGKPAIIMTPKADGSSTYYFADGTEIVALHQYLSEPYLDEFVKSFDLK